MMLALTEGPLYSASLESFIMSATLDSRRRSLEGYLRRFVLSHQDELSETELAKRLGISRKTLWERRQRMGMPWRDSRPPE